MAYMQRQGQSCKRRPRWRSTTTFRYLCLSPFLPSSISQRPNSHNQRPYQIERPTCRSKRKFTSIVSRATVLQPPAKRKMAMNPTVEASMIRLICSALEKSRSLRYVAHAPRTSDGSASVLQQRDQVTTRRVDQGYVSRTLY